MSIVVSVRAIMDKGINIWDKFCEDRGIDSWSVKKGTLSPNEEFKLTQEEAVKYCFVSSQD